MWEGDFLTGAEMDAIANRLAWSDGSLDQEYGLDGDSLDHVMSRDEYEWDYSAEIWVSTRDIWDGWDGSLPSRPK